MYIAAEDKDAFIESRPWISLINADVNADGYIDTADITLLRRHIANRTVQLGPQTTPLNPMVMDYSGEPDITFLLRPTENTPSTLEPGDTFTMEIYVDNPEGRSIASISDLIISFDSDILEWNINGDYNQFSNRPFAPGYISTDGSLSFISPTAIANNRARLNFESRINFTSSGVLLTLEFRVKSNAPNTDISFGMTSSRLYGLFGEVLIRNVDFVFESEKISIYHENIPKWTQPFGAHDAYNIGDVVLHNGNVWVSAINANVWEPGVFGWNLN